MPSYNRVMLMGNLTRDPELRYTNNGFAVARLSIAVNERYTTRGGEKKEIVSYFDCEVWNGAELICDRLRRGAPLFIEGRLRQDTWEDKSTGEKRNKIKIVVDNFQFIGAPRPGGGPDGGGVGMDGGASSGGASNGGSAGRPPAPGGERRPPRPEGAGPEQRGGYVTPPAHGYQQRNVPYAPNGYHDNTQNAPAGGGYRSNRGPEGTDTPAPSAHPDEEFIPAEPTAHADTDFDPEQPDKFRDPHDIPF